MSGIDYMAIIRLLSQALKSLHNAENEEQRRQVLETLVEHIEDALRGVPPLRLSA